MHISWHDAFTIKIVADKKTIVLNPHSPADGTAPFRSKADVVGLTDPTNPATSHLDGIQGEYLLLDSPGEYSTDGLTLYAMPWRTAEGTQRHVQRWQIEGMGLIYLGNINRDLTDQELQDLERGTIDILIVPVGGGDALNTKQALQVTTTIEPRVVIPINFHTGKTKPSKLDTVEQFAKEMGIDPKQREAKVILKAGKLPQEELHTILLQP